MVGQLALSAAIIAVAITMGFVGRRLRQEEALFWPVGGSLFLGFLLWLPAVWLGLVLTLLLFLLVLLASGRAWGGVLGAFAFYVVSALLPGGPLSASALLLLLVAWVSLSDAWAHFQRLRRAGSLVPGRIPEREVALSGTVASPNKETVPTTEEPCAAWWAESNEHQAYSRELITLQSAEGTVFFAPRKITLDIRHNYKEVKGAEARSLAEALGFSPKDKEEFEEVKVRWLAHGDAVYLVGRPGWENSRAGAGFRGSTLVPCFRVGDTVSVFLSTQSSEQVMCDARYVFWSWIAWGSLFLGLALFSLLA